MLQKLGKFEIIRFLGHGSMGEVYVGRDPLIGREVAIKVIHAANTLSSDVRDRFAREARAAGMLNHPNIVTIHEMGEDQGVLYLAMELVKGETMDYLLAEGDLGPRETVEVLAQVCDGLAVAHRHSVLHRDIKPSNIRVVRDGQAIQAKILDFGVAKHINSDMTDAGTVLGTVNYMAPEYLQSGRSDARSDLFAVGVVLHEALAGALPFDAPSPGAIIYRLLHEVPLPVPSERLEGLSKDVQAVLNRLLAKEPTHRFQTAEEASKALRGTLDHEGEWEGERTTVALRRKPSFSDPIKDRLRRPSEGLKLERFRPIPPLATPPPKPLSIPAPLGSARALPKHEPSPEVQMGALLEMRRQLLQALDMAPLNPKIHALLLVTYYRLRAFGPFLEHMRKVAALWIPSQRLQEASRFRQLVEEEGRVRALPLEVHAEFMRWANS